MSDVVLAKRPPPSPTSTANRSGGSAVYFSLCCFTAELELSASPVESHAGGGTVTGGQHRSALAGWKAAVVKAVREFTARRVVGLRSGAACSPPSSSDVWRGCVVLEKDGGGEQRPRVT